MHRNPNCRQKTLVAQDQLFAGNWAQGPKGGVCGVWKQVASFHTGAGGKGAGDATALLPSNWPLRETAAVQPGAGRWLIGMGTSLYSWA